jgi:hypothetical protein
VNEQAILEEAMKEQMMRWASTLEEKTKEVDELRENLIPIE